MLHIVRTSVSARLIYAASTPIRVSRTREIVKIGEF